MASRRQRQARQNRRKAPPRPRRNGPCIYCRSTTNEFNSREHAFGESAVGQNDKVLPRGAVCDPCNHEVNNRLDEVLAEFSPIAMMRVDLGIVGKSGKPPKAKFQNATLERRPAPAIERQPRDEVAMILHHNRVTRTTGPNSFDLQLLGAQWAHERNLADLTRALFKGVLGLMYLDHGPDFVLSERFDAVRAIIQGEPYSGFLLVPKKGTPQAYSEVKYWLTEVDGRPATLIDANFFGVVMQTEMEIRRYKAEKVPPEVAALVNAFEFTDPKRRRRSRG
jgi:hypothetical protein